MVKTRPEQAATKDDNTECSGTAINEVSFSQLRKGTKLVRRARAAVIGFLLASGITVATLTYTLLSANEISRFESQFKASARQVALMATKNAANIFNSIEALAEMYPTYAEQSNETMPFVTMKGFEAIAAGIRRATKIPVIHFSPYLHTFGDVARWNAYTVANQHWIAEGRDIARKQRDYYQNPVQYDNNTLSNFTPYVHLDVYQSNGTRYPSNDTGPIAPVWQCSPVPLKLDIINYDPHYVPKFKEMAAHLLATGMPYLSTPIDASRRFNSFKMTGPVSVYSQPVYGSVIEANRNRSIVGVVKAGITWITFFTDIVPNDESDFIIVTESCTYLNTYLIQGTKVTHLGEGDQHAPKYHDLKVTADFLAFAVKQRCAHLIHIYPVESFEANYITKKPWQYSATVLSIFVFASIVFLVYDWFVTDRQNRTEREADKSNAIVQDLFPGNVATQLFENRGNDGTDDGPLKTTRNGVFGQGDMTTIAELHPKATVIFADISGFTAWSSIRDPSSVFTLLEAIFQSFDKIAKKLGVFKMETVGDCYVAVCGLPKANSQHAVTMCRFARSILLKFRSVCSDLELTLGPDTSDLGLRIGLHSGPVTAGVLRGDRARFQLFGDTVNTASRVESTGMRERIHMSEQTANELIRCDKQDWVVRREDTVEAKGKGKLNTFWLKLSADGTGPHGIIGVSDGHEATASDWNVEIMAQNSDMKSRTERLIQWNSELLLLMLQRVVERREALPHNNASPKPDLSTLAQRIGDGSIIVEEVVEVIDMPELVSMSNRPAVELDVEVVQQLREYVATIASMYNDNPFHNFQHASHVTMSVSKLLARIVAPQVNLLKCPTTEQQEEFLHEHTCGIASDPLTQFTALLSGLIHDLDHAGVASGQLILEDPQLGSRYKNKSVAEQNSVDLAWNVLMAPKFSKLCAAIYSTEDELSRFRRLLVNSVIATDIFDKEQGTIRKNRWNKAFYETTSNDGSREARSRKATIVIEHLIQASDVAHTMQHWHVYQKWNQRLFNEMLTAFRAGRSDKDPSEGWYNGELWFFDNYVIPLTKKLKECSVFGVSSYEYYDYAMHNRDEWQTKGRDIVQQYLHEYNTNELASETLLEL